MNTRIVASIIVLLTLHNFAFAQDFDADSIYYTPIPKGKSQEKGRSKEDVKRRYPPRDPQIPSSEFDGDSIYYTPIPMDKSWEPEEKRSLFQEDPADSAKRRRFIDYFFNLQIGNLIGCNDCITDKEITFTASTVHGVTIGEKLRIGGGIGFDSYYDWQTIPVFGSLSWDLLGTKNTNAIFIQFNGGWSMARQPDEVWEYSQVDINGGPMFHGMAGLRLKYHDMRIAFTLGGKYQSVSATLETTTYYLDVNGMQVQGASSRTSLQQSMSRLAMAVTIGWK